MFTPLNGVEILFIFSNDFIHFIFGKFYEDRMCSYRKSDNLTDFSLVIAK